MREFQVSYAVWKATTQASGFPCAHRWRDGAGTEGDHELVEVYSGNRSFVFRASIKGADETDWVTVFKPASTTSESDDDAIATLIGLAPSGFSDDRHSSDGALIVKGDPGTEDTDPKFYPHHFTIGLASGATWHDLNIPSDGTSRMQYLTIQVRNPVLGDMVEVLFRANASGEIAPLDTVLGTFGGICPAFHTDANGWSLPRREPQDQGSAKLVPNGAKVSIRFTAGDASGRDLIIDAACHE
jgi:hypothetical protein